MKRNILLPIFMLFVLSIFIYSCDKDAKSGDVKINFDYQVGDQSFELNNWLYQSPIGYEYEITKARYLITRVSLLNTDGSVEELALAHFMDYNILETQSLLVSDVKAGEYNALKFTFGAKHIDNDVAVLPNTTHYQSFLWPEQITGDGLPRGFHYMQYEGRYKLSPSEIRNFNLHLGPTKGNDNSFEVTLLFSSDKNIDGNTLTINLNCDLNEWLVNPNTYDYETYGQGIMPNQVAQEELKANGSTVFSLGTVE